MSIYIDNGSTVKHYCTNNKTDKAVATLLEQIEDLVWSNTHEGYEVDIKEKENVKTGNTL